MASSVIGMNGWTKSVLASGFSQYTNRKTKMCAIVLDGYQVIGSSGAGNAGSISESLPETTVCSVFCAGDGVAVLRIESSGRLSLLNASLGNYIAGTVYGIAIFPIN